MNQALVAIITAPVLCAGFLFYFGRVARRVGLVDVPDARKRHRQSVPLVGGLAVWASLIVLVLLSSVSLGSYRILAFCLLIILAIGLLDDLKEVSAHLRIVVQIVVASILVYFGDVVVRSVGEVFFVAKPYGLGYAAIPFSIVAVVGTINAFNMIDGHDGLAGFMLVIPLAALTGLCYFSGVPYWSLVLLITVTLLPFLFFNLGFAGSNCKVFLGDAGSMSLGLLLVFLLIRFSHPEEGVLKVTSAPWLIALPLLDMIGVMVFRMREGRSPFHSDRFHIHHLLLGLGWSEVRVLTVLILTQLSFTLIGVFGSLFDWSDGLLVWICFLILAGYLKLLSLLRKQIALRRV